MLADRGSDNFDKEETQEPLANSNPDSGGAREFQRSSNSGGGATYTDGGSSNGGGGATCSGGTSYGDGGATSSGGGGATYRSGTSYAGGESEGGASCEVGTGGICGGRGGTHRDRAEEAEPQEEVEQNKAAEVDPAETNQPFQKENEQNTAAKVDPEETELKKKPFQEEDEQNKLDAEKYRKMKAQKNPKRKKENEKNRRNRKSRSNSSCWRRSSEGKDPERCSGAGKNITFQLAGVETVCMDIALWDFAIKPCIASNYDDCFGIKKRDIVSQTYIKMMNKLISSLNIFHYDFFDT